MKLAKMVGSILELGRGKHLGSDKLRLSERKEWWMRNEEDRNNENRGDVRCLQGIRGENFT